ncbi:unnamed protein product [Allacma fusca]|uniref:Immunoglobulin subtype domain-containing protein n=1 Tax=Allacma fusca TaxID=39272 RepID=A0A8J2PKW4_9HEXA|nr:unnamed protein product [Allacma fusca]
MNIHLLVVAALVCCVSAGMPSGYVMLSVTQKRSINDTFQLVCSHLDCAWEKCQLLSIFKDSNPFLIKDYGSNTVYVYPLPGSPFRLTQFRFFRTRVVVEGEIANQYASGKFTCQMTKESGNDIDFGEMTLFPCDNCTETEFQKSTLPLKVFSEGMNRTIGTDFEVHCDHRSCPDNDCIDLHILKDDKPFLRTEIGIDNINLYRLTGDPFGRIKLQKSENLTKVVVQIRNIRAGGKYSCEFVSLKGYFKDSRYLNIITTSECMPQFKNIPFNIFNSFCNSTVYFILARPSVKATTWKLNDIPTLESTTVQINYSTSSHIKPTQTWESSTVKSTVNSNGATTVEHKPLLLFGIFLANVFMRFV